MKHLMKKIVVGLIATASATSIAYAVTSTLPKPELVEIDVMVTKDLGETVDLLSKVSMRTEKDKPSVASNRRPIKYKLAMVRSKMSLNFDRFSEISVGIDEAYIPASSSKSGTADPAQMLVTIDDITSWTKFRMPGSEEAIEFPNSTRKIINVPIQQGRTNSVKQGDYTVTVTERTLSN